MMNCRWCHGLLEAKALFELSEVPQGAQALPTADELTHDQSVTLLLHRCADCGLVQMVGEPVAYYRDVVRANAFSDAMGAFRREQLSAWVRSHRLEGAKILEVGCGRGEFLGLLKQAGAVPVGTEHDGRSVTYAREAGFDVHPIYLGDKTLDSSEQFPAWASFNFMEHWPDPRVVLRNLRSSLSTEAVGLVEVPNFDMMLRERMLTEFIPDHIFYFSHDTLRRSLEMAGFEVISVDTIWQGYILSAQVRNRPQMVISGFETALNKLRDQLHSFANQHAHQGVAVWGAGHQALTTLALCDMGRKVRFVVDSAPFKQGKFTPVTHLRIKEPAAIIQEKVGAVLVMAAGYSAEVVEILRRDFDSALTVGVVTANGLELQ